MTEKQFYAALKKTRKMFGWKVKGNLIRGIIVVSRHLSMECCPITAVYFCENDTAISVGSAGSAGKFLGMKKVVTSKIIGAADGSHLPYIDKRRKRAARKALLTVLGLKEVAK